MVNNILLIALLITIVLHVKPFVEGFYDGYMDAKDGKPPKDLNKDKD
tara:strand:- start:3509 stop:3649 length:141 start_codon:yes stop_codon:yes gene_type:complete